MREDIIGMLKNAIDRGARADRVAESLINSGYNAIEVQQALAYVTGGTLSSLSVPQQGMPQTRFTSASQPHTSVQNPQMPAVPQPLIKQLPVVRENTSEGSGKIILLVCILLLLVSGLIATIIFKDKILDLFG